VSVAELMELDDVLEPVMGTLASARLELAQQWLSLSPREAQEHFEGELGRVHQALMGSGVRQRMPSPADDELKQKILQRLQEPTPTAGALLATMLLLHPHELPHLWTLDQLPPWLVNAYLSYTLEMPYMFWSEGEAETWVRHLESHLGHLQELLAANAVSQQWLQIAQRAVDLHMIPAYSARQNVCPLMSRRARILEQLLTATGHPLDHDFAPSSPRSRIRLGVLAIDFRPNTEPFASLPLYHHLDRRRFEVILLSIVSTGCAMERLCAGCADRFIALPPKLQQQVQVIREADLDILLVTTAVTAAPNVVTLLAAHRLARVQVASICSSVTTGLRHVDWHLSGTYVEPPSGAQEHYSERLLLLDGTGHCYDFGTEPAGPLGPPPSRPESGVASDAIVFVSGANAYKISPELENTWAQVLAATPNSRLLLHLRNPNWTFGFPYGALIARMKDTLQRHGVSPQRLLLFRPSRTRQEFLRRMQMGDVYLDSFPFSGATTLLDGLLVGLPPVVMNGCQFRSLMGAGFMRELHMQELIADNPRAYIQLAVKLATDATYRAAIGQKISAAMSAGPRFLDAQDYARQIGEALGRAWESRESG